jgi:hypothetical protein
MSMLICSLAAFSQDYYEDNRLRYEDHIYAEGIQTVILHKTGFELSAPMIELGSGNTLTLHFDDLFSRGLEYQYTVELCDANWQPADMMQMEYLEGVFTEYFGDGEQSLNTVVPYMHYQTQIPSEDMSFKISGNYLLKVYEADNPDNLVLTKKFYVFESLVKVESKVMVPQTGELQRTHHEISLNLNTTTYPLQNIYGGLKVYVQQNGRKDNMLLYTQPKAVSGSILKYNLISDIMFEAGNEFRGLDTRSLRSPVPSIQSVVKDTCYQVILKPDPNRSMMNYLTYEDLNGGFQIINRDPIIRSSHIESDYVNVHFTFPAPYPYREAAIYLLGEFNNWNFSDEYKMIYNYDTQQYENKLLLKQGYFNYMYAYLPNGKTEAKAQFTEGTFVNTQNDYTIYVYYRDAGQIYDRLIAIESIESQF